MISILEF